MSSIEVVATPQAAIQARAQGAIDVALLSYEKDVHVGAGAKRLAAQATAEYHDRFLIELIQNAHDAHPKDDESGDVEILFVRDEGEFGALYVANQGRPFSHSNFSTICAVGLTDKTAGEAIGNKGLGFKSVLQICDRPEVYSAEPSGSIKSRKSFEGFCFSFASDDELLQLLNGDQAQFDIVRRETSIFHIPVALANQPDRVREFAQRGFATVVRLPLNREEAADKVLQQLQVLRTSSAPLLLFLDRLRHLGIRETGADFTGCTDLRRTTQQLSWPEARGVEVRIVDLAECGRYLSASRVVASEQLQQELSAAVEAKELEESWLEWRDDAIVTAAVRVDAALEEGRLYTYLPMEALAPFAGHFNAPFYARLDRRDIDKRLKLNMLLLDVGAQACRLVAEAIAARNDVSLAGAAVDFFAWEPTEASRLEHALGGSSLATDDRVLPVAAVDGRTWSSLRSTYIWSARQWETLTATAIARAAGADILDTGLGASRLSRIERLQENLLGRKMRPWPNELAGWVEQIAASQAAKAGAPMWWDSFYRELATAFEHGASHLAGRHILLDEEKKLRAAGNIQTQAPVPRPTVFFQPVREQAEGIVDIDVGDDVRIPKSLRTRIVFMNADLQWLERVGNTRRKTKSRVFFEEHGLIKPYSARSILEQIRSRLQESRSKQLYADALRLAYRLQRLRDYDERPALRDLGLRVPCESGWIPAADAYFSDTWPGTLGRSLTRLIGFAAGTSEEISALSRVLLLPPDKWPLSVDPDDWVSFLQKTGVRDGLWPIASKSARIAGSGDDLQTAIVSKAGFGEGVRAAWIEAVSDHGGTPCFPKGRYVNQTPLWLLPGQSDYEELSERARTEYGALVAASCGQWGEENLSVSFKRSDVFERRLDPFSWPTPLAAFVGFTRWMPTRVPQRPEQTDFVALREAWHFTEKPAQPNDYARPDFSPLLQASIRGILDDRPKSLARLREFGLNVWNEPAHAAKLVGHLGSLVQTTRVPDSLIPSLARAYDEAWTHALEQDLGPQAAQAKYLVVTRSNRLCAFDTEADTGEELYVRDGGSPLADKVLRLSSLPLLDVGDHAGERVAELLVEQLGNRVLRTSEETIVVLGDDATVIPGDSGVPLLTPELQWVEWLLVAALYLQRNAFRRFTDQVRDRVLTTLRSTRIRFAQTISFRIRDEIVPTPRAMRDAVPLPDARFPTIVVRGNEPHPVWAQFGGILPALTDLIGYPEIAAVLQLAVKRLAPEDGFPHGATPSIAEIADALDEDLAPVREVIESLHGSATALLDVLAPVLVVCIGREEFDRFAVEARRFHDEQDFFASISKLHLPVPQDKLRTLAREGVGADDLRQGLEIPLHRFNNALRELGRSPIHYVEEQASAFETFAARRRHKTLLALRRAYLAVFRAGGSLATYVAARDRLSSLGPDPSWLEKYEIPPEKEMNARLRDWLHDATGNLELTREELAPLDKVQRENRGRLHQFIQTASRIILAWSSRNGHSAPEVWTRQDPEDEIWNALLADGQTDFDPLDAEGLIEWLVRQGHWLQSMPATLDLPVLGLTQADVEQAQTEKERERSRREFVRRSIELAGQRYSAAPEDLAALAEAARAGTTESFLSTQATFTRLAHVSSPGSRGAGGGTRSNAGSLTESQKAAIGLVGEVVALEWLKRRYAGASDDCWRSGYRNRVLGGSLGNDSLGFDFEVPVGRTSYLFEVKATTGDERQIDLGESEVRAVRQHAQTDRYRILYIPFALDPARRAIYVLPNPFAERGRELYQLAGSGLRYRFHLEGA